MKSSYLKHLILLLLVVISCNKQAKDYQYTAGTSKKMNVIQHQLSAKAVFKSDFYCKDSVLIDLDQDGINDLVAISIIDDGFDFSSDYYQELSLTIINKKFVLSEKVNSGQKTAVFDQVEFNFDGTFPRLTEVFKVVCGDLPVGDSYFTANTAKFLLEGEDLIDTEFNTTAMLDSKVNLKVPAYVPLPLYEASVGGDSLIGARFEFADLCEPVPEGIAVYVPFLKQEDFIRRYGWIKLQVSGNELLIIETAIQKP